MKLHTDVNAFKVLLQALHKQSGIRADVLEKDYYVVLMLKELAAKQQAGLPAYFKGGTALYKALRTTNRFSEDIDLSVDTRGCSRTQNDRLLERAAKKYESLPRDASQGRTNRSEVVAVFTYTPVSEYDASDALQRFGRVKLEATSFTISEPVESLEVSPVVYDLGSAAQRRILREQYEVAPFPVLTITMERIFIDKLFAAEAYVRKSDETHRAFEAAKHIYDLAVMSAQPKIQALLASEENIRRLLDIRVQEEAERLDGIPGVMPKEFSFFETAGENAAVRKAYTVMQNQYVFRAEDRIDYDVALARVQTIFAALEKNRGWKEYH